MEMSIVEIDTAGDVELCVGTPVVSRLLVSSKVLKVGSRRFQTILAPLCYDDSPQPQEVFLPDDSAIGIQLLCQCLHGQVVPESLSPSDSLEFIETLERYMCEQRSAPFRIAEIWIQYVPQRPSPEDIYSLLKGAFMLRSVRAVERIAKHAINRLPCEQQFSRWLVTKKPIYPAELESLLYLIDFWRVNAQNKLSQSLLSHFAISSCGRTPFDGHTCAACSYCESQNTNLLIALKAGSLYPWPTQGSLSDFQRGLERAYEAVNLWGTGEDWQILSQVLLVEKEKVKKCPQNMVAWIEYLELQP